MGQCRFAGRIDIKADIKASFVVNDVPSVKDRGRLGHGVEYFPKVNVPVQVPLG
jgi:hypothetical protein